MDTKYSSIRLTDLPDEILMIIFKKLTNIELFYSLMNVDPRFISHRLVNPRSLAPYYVYPLLDSILDRFCESILPKINVKVGWLELESTSMERVLHAANYPNLFGVVIYNIQIERALQFFSDGYFFTSIYKNQIVKLVIDSGGNTVSSSGDDINAALFTQIISSFPKLQALYLGPSLLWYQYIYFNNAPPTVASTMLSCLYVNLTKFQDCLFLLDGRFNQLGELHVNIKYIVPSPLGVDNKEKLPNLKSFRFYCDNGTKYYNELVVPLLRRMSNLETLDLSLQIELKTPFIDGHHLKLNIISHMSLLNKFTFNIYSDTEFYNQTNTPSNECIQQTFQDFPNKQIISCVDYFPEIRRSRCHFYSYPYSSKLRIYKNISNNFPDGIFRKVRRVSLYDERPFEHEFFFRISQSFPSMENLSIFNRKPQKQKQFRRSPNQNQHLSIIKYDQLVELELRCAHKDYYRQFLFDDRSCLPEKISVYMDYRLAKKVTHNFTSKAARNNCAKIIFTAFVTNSKFPDRIKDYLPRARDLDLDL